MKNSKFFIFNKIQHLQTIAVISHYFRLSIIYVLHKIAYAKLKLCGNVDFVILKMCGKLYAQIFISFYRKRHRRT